MAAQRPDGSPGLSAVRTNESTALLGEEHGGHAQFLLPIPLYLYHTIKATLFCSKANLLLVFIPLSIIGAVQGWHPVAVFALSFLAIFPLAELLSWSTEQLSASVGQTLSGLLNATFGNAVEMIVGITALNQSEFRIVQSSMVGSILSGTLLILGCCLYVAGYNKKEVRFNVDLTSIMSSLMIVSSASLVIPSASYFTDLPSGVMEPPSSIAEPKEYILTLSHIAAVILLFFYVLYLVFQLKTHADVFAESGQIDEDESHIELDPWAASIVLILATVGVSVCSDYLVDSIDGFVEALGVSRAFIGLIIVPIVGNAGELVATVNQAKKGNIDFALNLIVGSTLQIALFVTPFLVILGWIIERPMSLRFDTFQTTVLSLSVIVVNCLIRGGRSNYFEGFLLIATYFIIAIAFYVHPDLVDTILS